MDQKKVKQNFFDGGKLNVRKLRHDMAGALGIIKNMLYLRKKDPAKRAEYDDLMQKAIGRLTEINDSLHLISNIKDLVEVKDAK